MNKKGFTLTEILVVIAVIGLLIMLIIPNVVKIFSDSVSNTMKIQENEIADSALLYLDDHCKNPVGTNNCTLSRNSNYTYSGQISLNTLINEEYIDQVSLQNTICSGCVVFDENKAKAYITCGEIYTTKNYVCN